MFNKKDKVKKSASKTDKRSKKEKKMDQQPQSSNDCEEVSTQEELDYFETQARRRQAESDDEGEETGRYQDDNDLSAGEDEQLLSESRLRTDQAQDARVFQADEDKTPSPSNKKRRQAQDQITGISSRFRLPQAEQPQGPVYTNPDLTFTPSTSPSPNFVGTDTQSVSSTSAYPGEFTSNSDNIILDRDLGRHGEVTGDGLVLNTNNSISRLERLIRVKSVADKNQKLSRGLEIIRSQETISLTDPDFLVLMMNKWKKLSSFMSRIPNLSS
jgi:hypothetical protein